MSKEEEWIAFVKVLGLNLETENTRRSVDLLVEKDISPTFLFKYPEAFSETKLLNMGVTDTVAAVAVAW
jgi:hypothetical protein